MDKIKNISILGCGWLGLPLAEKLLSAGFKVKGSTTSENKLESLQNVGIDSYLIELSENKITGNVAKFLAESTILIIDIPPKLRGENKENFVAKINNLCTFIEKSTVKNVIFISSTSVYADKNTNVTEETNPNPETESGKQLLETEHNLHENTNFKTTVLRFGGLIGGDRNPSKSLAGRENIENPNGPINLIHRNDCIRIIEKIIEKNVWGETFNAAVPFHPTRQNYYQSKAAELNLPLPKFNHSQPSKGKTIDSKKLMIQLDFTFSESL